MRAIIVCVVVLSSACATPELKQVDTGVTRVQEAIDSLSESAESGAHSSPASAGKGTSPIIERAQRDSAGRALPRPGATQSSTIRRDTMKRDSLVVQPGRPNPADPKNPTERHPRR